MRADHGYRRFLRYHYETGAIDAGIYAFIRKTKGLERLAIPLFFILFSLGGATFGMAEECIPFSMIMVPFVIALGYDSIVAVTVTYVASQVGTLPPDESLLCSPLHRESQESRSFPALPSVWLCGLPLQAFCCLHDGLCRACAQEPIPLRCL